MKTQSRNNYVGMWGFMLNETWQPYHSANYVTSHSLSSILLLLLLLLSHFSRVQLCATP